MTELLKQSTAVTKKMGPFLDDSDGKTEETALTIAQADIRLSKNGGDIAQSNNTAGATHDELGYYGVPLDATDTNTLGSLRVIIHKSGALPVWRDFMVVPANVYDSLFSTDKLQIDVAQALGTAVEATSGQLHVLDDEGNTIANESKQDTIDTVVDAIRAKTDSLPTDPASETNVNANETKIDTIDSNIDAILMDTGTDGVIVATSNDKTGYSLSSAGVQAIWDALTSALTTTNSIGKLLVDNVNATISSRSAFNAASDDVSVRELKNTALADLFNTDSGDDYDTAVSGSLVKEIADNAGGSGLTEGGIADAVWDEPKSGHVGAGTFGNEVQLHALSTEIAALNDITAANVWAYVVEGTLTAAHAMQALMAAMAGKASGAGTETLTFRDFADTKNRITATVDTEDGDRTAISFSFD